MKSDQLYAGALDVLLLAEAVWKLLADALAPGAQGICAAKDEPRNRVNQAAIARVMPCTPMILIIRFML